MASGFFIRTALLLYSGLCLFFIGKFCRAAYPVDYGIYQGVAYDTVLPSFFDEKLRYALLNVAHDFRGVGILLICAPDVLDVSVKSFIGISFKCEREASDAYFFCLFHGG